ncbi:MAG: MalY/PatB family protein [Paracoccaceae bacterium]
MNFDEVIDRRATHSDKWDNMQARFGVAPDDGLAMWVADMDFRSPDCVQNAVRDMLKLGNYGYFGDYSDYRNAIIWWMQNRHQWPVQAEWIFTAHGLGNAIGLTLQAFCEPGDEIILFTPVYHAFARIIKAGGRGVVQCELSNNAGHYELDFAAYDAQMTGREKLVLLCSPHNPGGRIWSASELTQIAEFCERHDLLLIADEVHHDLVYPGNKFTPMALAAPQIVDRLIVLTAPSKTFNTAGTHTGNVIIENAALRAKFAALMRALSVSANNFGVVMTTAAYSPEGAAWVDELVCYLDGNRKIFDAGINAIPGLKSVNMQATYLAWVDFSGTGMEMSEVITRIQKTARIAADHGPTFGKGGENFMRFNIGTQRARIIEAVERLQAAFADLQ